MRIDKPTLQCDRCGYTTTDLQEMARFQPIHYDHMSGTDKWDLCMGCAKLFHEFVKGDY